MNWTPIWHQAAAPAFAMGFLAGKKKTVVYSVISQVSGEKLRVRFSNHYGKKPYTIGGLTVCIPSRGTAAVFSRSPRGNAAIRMR